MTNFVVIGRRCGDDEDSVWFYEAETKEEACGKFRAEMVDFYDMNPKALALDEGIFINHVLTSSSTIASV